MTIDELTQLTAITKSTLRYYEQEGIIPAVPRDNNGHRIYTEEIIEWVEFVTSLKETGMPLRTIKHYTQLYNQGDATLTQRRQLMEEHQQHIHQTIQQTLQHLERINYKIALYDVQLDKVKRMP